MVGGFEICHLQAQSYRVQLNYKQGEIMLKQIRQYIENLWLSILAISILMIIFGILAVVVPDWAIAAIIQILAVILLFFGCISFVQIFSNLKHERSISGAIISTLIFIAAGLTLLLSPSFTIDLVLTVIGVVVLLRGIIDIAVGLGVQKDDSDKITWSLSGFLGIIAGILMITKPGLTSAVLMIILGAYALVAGITGVIYAVKVRKGINKISEVIDK